jgi:hypothetical protein
MSIAIVCMVNNTAINLHSKSLNQSSLVINETHQLDNLVVDECPNTVSSDKKNVVLFIL